MGAFFFAVYVQTICAFCFDGVLNALRLMAAV
jgi:hypothetical protein